MNTSKKLKLTLLATSILFFPKAGHTMMKPEDERSSAGPSRPDQERPVFNSLLPVGLSNQVPTTSTDYRSGSNRMKQLFGQTFIPTEEIYQRLSLLESTSPENFQGIIGAIRTQLVEKFTTSSTSSSRSSIANDSALQASLQDVVSFALTLPKGEIEQRSKGMIRTIVDLNNALPNSIQHALLPPFALTPRFQTEEEVDRSYNYQLSEQVRTTPNLIYFFKDLLELYPSQITQRTEAIKKNADFLLPSRPKIYSKEWTEEVFSIMKFLLKHKTQEIANCADSMAKLLSFSKNAQHTYAQYTYNNSIKRAAIPLDNPTLEERANSYTATLEALPGLEPIAIQLSYLSLQLEPTVFTSYVNLHKEKLSSTNVERKI